jgi:hypothetical protein
MHALDIEEHARRMWAEHGSKAILEAAQRAVQLENEGREDEARDWRRIEAALALMSGPRET